MAETTEGFARRSPEETQRGADRRGGGAGVDQEKREAARVPAEPGDDSAATEGERSVESTRSKRGRQRIRA